MNYHLPTLENVEIVAVLADRTYESGWRATSLLKVIKFDEHYWELYVEDWFNGVDMWQNHVCSIVLTEGDTYSTEELLQLYHRSMEVCA